MNTPVGYLPGDRWLVAGDRAIVYTGGEAADALRWWPSVRSGADAAELIGELFRDGALGTGLPLAIICTAPAGAVAPADVVAPADDPDADGSAKGSTVRALVQGGITVVVETVAGEQIPVSGAGLVTWSEVLVADAAVVYVACADTLPAASDLLPMPAGVVRAGSVRWELCDAAVAAASEPPGAAVSDLAPVSDPDADEAVTVISMVPAPDPTAPAPDIEFASTLEPGPDDAQTVLAGPSDPDRPADDAAFAVAGLSKLVSSAVAAPDALAAPDDAAADDAADDEGADDAQPALPAESIDADATQSVPEGDFEQEVDLDIDRGLDQHLDQHIDQDRDLDRDAEIEPRTPDAGPVAEPDRQLMTLPSLENPLPMVTVPPFTPPPFIPPTLDLPPITPPPFVPAATTLPPVGPLVVHGPVSAGEAASEERPPTERPAPAAAEGLPPAERPPASEGRPPTDQHSQQPLMNTRIPAEPVAPQLVGDHDGLTQLAEELPADYRPAPMPPAPAAGQVYASICPVGHANAPHSGNCRVCGAPIAAGQPVLAQQPVLGRIRLSTGPVFDIDRRIVIGRAPSVARVPSSDLPKLVTVPSPNQDISRSHVEIRAEDWHLVVTDLQSTNGTVIRPSDRPEQLLHQGQSVVVEIGWTVDLGDGIAFLVEGAQ
ncbi:FHA domain-containing protein [Nakamurella lactea]|uniref:FHA domain-containing protein n=1 Tax=Nakamurella lactea TaxID=459515 RepID=UPI0004296BE3|nr:FHA domain-containing protein [Nakamurella lactea]